MIPVVFTKSNASVQDIPCFLRSSPFYKYPMKKENLFERLIQYKQFKTKGMHRKHFSETIMKIYNLACATAEQIKILLKPCCLYQGLQSFKMLLVNTDVCMYCRFKHVQTVTSSNQVQKICTIAICKTIFSAQEL